MKRGVKMCKKCKKCKNILCCCSFLSMLVYLILNCLTILQSKEGMGTNVVPHKCLFPTIESTRAVQMEWDGDDTLPLEVPSDNRSILDCWEGTPLVYAIARRVFVVSTTPCDVERCFSPIPSPPPIPSKFLGPPPLSPCPLFGSFPPCAPFISPHSPPFFKVLGTLPVRSWVHYLGPVLEKVAFEAVVSSVVPKDSPEWPKSIVPLGF